ncbi:MAG: hypothetical protein HY744_03765 [Deltaproteobacteria bacterium]|nr:hypothetical protein [Deltaproteobacteria bacterium]
MAEEQQGPPSGRDLVFVHGEDEASGHYDVVRCRVGRIELGQMAPLCEGRPIVGEVVRLKRRPEHPRLFDAQTLLPAPTKREDAPEAAREAGPPKVASPSYRENWDAIFGRRSGAAPVVAAGALAGGRRAGTGTDPGSDLN